MADGEVTVVQLPHGLGGRETLDILENDDRLVKLCRALHRDERLRRLLFLSKHDLFEHEESMELAVFHTARASSEGSAALARILAEGFETNSSLDTFAEKFLGPVKQESLPSIVEGIAFALLSTARASKDLKLLVAREQLSFADWQRYLRQYGGMDSLIERIKNSSSELQLGDEYAQFMENAGERLAKDLARSLDQLALATKNALPNLLVQLHSASQAWVTRIRDLTRFSLDDLEYTLDELVRLNLLETKSAIAWCENCGKERPAYQILEGTWAPSRYAKHTCFVCQKTVSYAAIFFPSDSLRKILLSKDGLLAAYVGWKLREGNLAAREYFHAGGRENDYLTTNGTLVEVKSYQTSRDAGSLRRSLGEDINRLRKRSSQLCTEESRVAKFAFITNLGPATIQRAGADLSPTAGKPIQLFGLQDISEALG